MRKGKWLVAVLMVFIFIFVSACGNNTNDPNNTNDGNNNPPAENGNEAPGPLGKYENPIDLTMAASRSASEFAGGETDGDNRWIDEYAEALGINVEVLWAAPQGDQYNERVGVTIASGDLPDVMLVDKVTLGQLVESDLIADITDAYDQYASPLLKEVIDLDGNGYAESQATFDGRMMAIPEESANLAGFMLNIRKDWLDAVGLDAPETMEDMLEISRAFTHDDPDGNGQDDTYGLAANSQMKTWDLDLSHFFNGYGAYTQNWVKDENGELVYGSIQPEVRDALLQLQKMYADGQIDPEFAVKDVGQVAEDFGAGKLGMGYVPHFGPILPFQDVRKLNPDMDLVTVPMVALGGMEARPEGSAEVENFYVVRKGYEHPEAAVKMANLFLDIWFGEQSERYAEMITGELPNGEQENFFQYAPLKISHMGKNMEIHKRIVKALDGELPTEELNAEETSYYELITAYKNGEGDENADGWAYNNVYGHDSTLSVQLGYVENDKYQVGEFYGLPTPTMETRWSTLTGMESEVFPKIIMGDSIEKFDKFVEDWNNLGGADITEEVNAWYQEKQN